MELELLKLMVRERMIAPRDLAGRLGVSTRTVRTYLRRANDALKGVARIEFQRGRGYVLQVADQAAFERALDSLEAQTTPASNSATRVHYLLNDLLSRNEWTTLDDLSRVLFVSRATISGELKQVEEVLTRFGLALERRPHRGIRVTGSEVQRRLCLASTAVDTLTGTPTDERLHVRLSAISRAIDDASREAGYEISSVMYQNLLVHIAVALVRIEEGCYVPMRLEQLEGIRTGGAFAVAQRVARRIAEDLGIELPEEEVAYIAIHLAGKQMLPELTDPDGTSVISPEVWDAVDRMLETVWATYRFDLRGDLELYMNLARHITPLAVRLRFGLNMENPLIEDIKVKYPFAWAMASDSSSVLVDAFGGELSEAEVGYIALAYALAIERSAAQPRKHNVLVVCASGRGSAHLLEYRVRDMFGAYLDRVETCDAGHVAERDFSQIDYVFTTVPIDAPLPVPVCSLPFFFDRSDADRVTAFLQDGGRDDASITRFFSPQLFRGKLGAQTRDEALHALCADMREAGVVPDAFERFVFERENFMSTAFGSTIALPHAIKACSARTSVCVGLAEQPIDWGGRDVQVIFLISFSYDPEDDLARFYQCIARLLSRTEAVEALLAERTYSRLMGLIAAIEQELLQNPGGS